MRRVSILFAVLLPFLSLGASTPKGTYSHKLGSYGSNTYPKTVSANYINAARIGDNVPAGEYWTPTGIDFSDAHVWYFSPTGDSTGTGTRSNPFPMLGAAVREDSIRAGGGYTWDGTSGHDEADTAYVTKYAANGTTEWKGKVEAGDVIVLMPGEHKNIWFSGYYNTGYIAIVGMRGAYVSPGVSSKAMYFNGFRRFLVEDVEFRGRRDAFETHGLTSAAPNGYKDDYDSGPYFIRTNHPASTCYDLIINNCTFWPGENHVPWDAENWNTGAPNAIYLGSCDSTIVSNCMFKGLNYPVKGQNLNCYAFLDNTVRGWNGDIHGFYFTNAQKMYHFQIDGNDMTDQYMTNMNHPDGIAQFASNATDTSRVRFVKVRNNRLLFTSRLDRNPSHFATADFGYHVGLGFTLQPPGETDDCNVAQDIQITNNVIAQQLFQGIYFRADATNVTISNNTVVPIWPEHDIPQYMQDEFDGPGIFFSTEDDSSTYVNCVIANNAVTYLPAAVDGVTLANNYDQGYNDDNNAGYSAYSHVMNPINYNLIPAEDSPLIDTGSATYAPSADYRGTARPIGFYDDIGAYESPNYKLLVDFDITSTYAGGAYISAGLGGTTAVSNCTVYIQDKLSGGTFADAYNFNVYGGEIAMSYTTDYPTSILPDSLYARARIYYGGEYGPWFEADPVYVEPEAEAGDAPLASFASASYDSLGAGGKIRLLGNAFSDSTGYWRFAFVDTSDTPDTTFGSYTDTLLAAGDTIQGVFNTGDAPVEDKTYQMLAWVNTALDQTSAPDTANFSIQRAIPATPVYVTKSVVVSNSSTLYGAESFDYTVNRAWGAGGFGCANADTNTTYGGTSIAIKIAGIPFLNGGTERAGLLSIAGVDTFLASHGITVDDEARILAARLFIRVGFYDGNLSTSGEGFKVIDTMTSATFDNNWNAPTYHEYQSAGTEVVWTPHLSQYDAWTDYGTVLADSSANYGGSASVRNFDVTGAVKRLVSNEGSLIQLMLCGQRVDGQNPDTATVSWPGASAELRPYLVIYFEEAE